MEVLVICYQAVPELTQPWISFRLGSRMCGCRFTPGFRYVSGHQFRCKSGPIFKKNLFNFFFPKNSHLNQTQRHKGPFLNADCGGPDHVWTTRSIRTCHANLMWRNSYPIRIYVNPALRLNIWGQALQYWRELGCKVRQSCSYPFKVCSSFHL